MSENLIETDDITPEAKRAIVNNEITLWRNTRYQAELRRRVAVRTGAPAEQLKTYDDELVRIETCLDALKEELAQIPA